MHASRGRGTPARTPNPPSSGRPTPSTTVAPLSGRARRRSDSDEERHLGHHHRHDSADRRRPKKKKAKKRTHRAYGLPNANQIFLTMVVVAMLFVELLRPNWLIFKHSDATAGLAGLRFEAANGTSASVSWSAFCDPSRNNYTLPLDDTVFPALEQPFARDDAQRACATHTPEILRALTSTAIALSLLSVIVALYFHLGAPTQRQVELLGAVPGGALLATGVLGTAGLAVWQEKFGPYDNGDCFSVAVASTVIAYVVAISMAIRWRWPGIFAVDNEQQAFEARRNWRRQPPLPSTTATATPTTTSDASNSPHATSAFHAVV